MAERVRFVLSSSLWFLQVAEDNYVKNANQCHQARGTLSDIAHSPYREHDWRKVFDFAPT